MFPANTSRRGAYRTEKGLAGHFYHLAQALFVSQQPNQRQDIWSGQCGEGFECVQFANPFRLANRNIRSIG
jgi:hypothetical protein